MKEILFIVLLFSSQAILACCHVNSITIEDSVYFDIDGPFSIDQVEEKEVVSIEIDGAKISKPFGYQNEKWEKIKLEMQDGDCIYHINSDKDSWDSLSGREGYILYRNGKVVSVIFTKIS